MTACHSPCTRLSPPVGRSPGKVTQRAHRAGGHTGHVHPELGGWGTRANRTSDKNWSEASAEGSVTDRVTPFLSGQPPNCPRTSEGTSGTTGKTRQPSPPPGGPGSLRVIHPPGPPAPSDTIRSRPLPVTDTSQVAVLQRAGRRFSALTSGMRPRKLCRGSNPPATGPRPWASDLQGCEGPNPRCFEPHGWGESVTAAQGVRTPRWKQDRGSR